MYSNYYSGGDMVSLVHKSYNLANVDLCGIDNGQNNIRKLNAVTLCSQKQNKKTS